MKQRSRARPADRTSSALQLPAILGQRVPASFRPSRHAFAFTNSWPRGPAVSIRTPAGRVGIGNAARGLCGGMVFAALDYWQAGREPPADQPAPGTPLFRFIVRRLLQSWRLPAGVLRYYLGMLAADGDLAERTISQEWPSVRVLLDRGLPAPLGLVTVGGANPFLLGHNHQVVAYGYHQAGAEVTLLVYDPNSGPADSVAIRFSTASPGTGFAHNIAVSWPVRGFFVTKYTPAEPPPTANGMRAGSGRRGRQR
jgi:hypothetical protein